MMGQSKEEKSRRTFRRHRENQIEEVGDVANVDIKRSFNPTFGSNDKSIDHEEVIYIDDDGDVEVEPSKIGVNSYLFPVLKDYTLGFAPINKEEQIKFNNMLHQLLADDNSTGYPLLDDYFTNDEYSKHLKAFLDEVYGEASYVKTKYNGVEVMKPRPNIDSTFNFSEQMKILSAMIEKRNSLDPTDRGLRKSIDRYGKEMVDNMDKIIDQELIKTRLFIDSFQEELRYPISRISNKVAVLSGGKVSEKDAQKLVKEISKELDKVFTLHKMKQHPTDYEYDGSGEVLSSPAGRSARNLHKLAKLYGDMEVNGTVEKRVTELVNTKITMDQIKNIYGGSEDLNEVSEGINLLLDIVQSPSMVVRSPDSNKEILKRIQDNRDVDGAEVPKKFMERDSLDSKYEKKIDRINRSFDLGLISAKISSVVEEALSEYASIDEKQLQKVKKWTKPQIDTMDSFVDPSGAPKTGFGDKSEYYKTVQTQIHTNQRAHRRISDDGDGNLTLNMVVGKTGMINAKPRYNNQPLSSDLEQATHNFNALLSRLNATDNDIKHIRNLMAIMEAEGFDSEALILDFITGNADLLDPKGALIDMPYAEKDEDLMVVIQNVNKLRERWGNIVKRDTGVYGEVAIPDVGDFDWKLLGFEKTDEVITEYFDPLSFIDAEKADIEQLIELGKNIGILEVEDDWKDSYTDRYTKVKIDGNIINTHNKSIRAIIAKKLDAGELTEEQFIKLMGEKTKTWKEKDIIAMAIWLGIDLRRDAKKERSVKIDSYLKEDSEEIFKKTIIEDEKDKIQAAIKTIAPIEKNTEINIEDVSNLAKNKDSYAVNRVNLYDSKVQSVMQNLQSVIGQYSNSDALKEGYLLGGAIESVFGSVGTPPSDLNTAREELIAHIDNNSELSQTEKKNAKSSVYEIFTPNKTQISGLKIHNDDNSSPTVKQNLFNLHNQMEVLGALANYLKSSNVQKEVAANLNKKTDEVISRVKENISSYRIDPVVSDAISTIQAELKNDQPNKLKVERAIQVIESRESPASFLKENVAPADHLKYKLRLKSIAGKSRKELTQSDLDFIEYLETKDGYNLDAYNISLIYNGDVLSYSELSEILDGNRKQLQKIPSSSKEAKTKFLNDMRTVLQSIIVGNYDVQTQLKKDELFKDTNANTIARKIPDDQEALRQPDDPYIGDEDEDLKTLALIPDDGNELFGGGISDDDLQYIIDEYQTRSVNVSGNNNNNQNEEISEPISEQSKQSKPSKPEIERDVNDRRVWLTSNKNEVAPQINVSSANLGRLLNDFSTRMDSSNTSYEEAHLVQQLSNVANEMNELRKEIKGVPERAAIVKGKRATKLLKQQKKAIEHALEKKDQNQIITDEELEDILGRTNDQIERLEAITK